jgi:hypothetical protein
MNEIPISKSNEDQQTFSFTWYHREEIQVLMILIGLIVFFAHRSLWVLGTLAASVVCILFALYIIRILEIYLIKHEWFPRLIQRYHNLKTTLHGHSIERSRIAMALLGAWVVGVLCLHRIHLAQLNRADRTPTDIYWILFLGWYCIVCTVIAMYLIWLWNTWSQNESKHKPFLDGLVASLFFYRGLSRKNRIVTFIAAFWLGGLPSYVAIRLTPETPYGYWIACGLIVPLIGLFLGGAYYTMRHLQNSSANKS